MKSAAVALTGRVHAAHRAPAAPRLSHFIFEYLLVLPIGAAIALAWAALDPVSYHRVTYAAAFAVNEVAMVFFFGLMTKEIVEATAPGGVFHPWRRVSLPVIAAGGGIAVPVLLYFVMFRALDARLLGPGWPVLFAVDLAMAYFLARIIFGRHPAVPFVLLMAIAANGFGFLALALTHPARDAHPLAALLLMGGALAAAAMLRRARVRSFWPYLAAGGSLSWAALFVGGVHPAFALVPIVAFLPHAPRDPGFFVDAPPNARDALERFERWCRLPAQAALFLFAVVNAGVTIRAVEQGQWAVPLSLLAGRPAGVLVACAIAIAAGVHMPHRIGWRELVVIGSISSVGFTLALFFASAVFPAGQLLSETKMGALLTLGAAPVAFAAARLLRVGRFHR